MTTKSLKKFTELLNRSEGISIVPIIVVMVLMSVMGAVFTSIMGGWKVSAPMTINSNKAYYLAETAAMFALQDAKNRFFSKDAGGNEMFNFGTSTDDPYVVSSVTTGNVTEVADYWFERPGVGFTDDDATTGTNDDVVDDDADDGNFDDDVDGDGVSDLHTIIATGRVKIGNTTLAKRQIKILATIYPSPDATVTPGVQTSGAIEGTGGSLEITNPANPPGSSSTSFGVGTNNNTGPDPEDDIVIRPAQFLDENYVKAMAVSQGHDNPGDLTIGNSNDDYPEPGNPSFYFYYNSPMDNIPNFTYVGNDLTVGSNRKAHGVIWAKGDVVLNGTATMNAIIICDGDITLNGTSDIVGGIIHKGSVINGNGNPNTILVKNEFFEALSRSIPIVTVKSWQEAVSAN